MKKTFSSKKSAFSLIELSIVLIVIGLLIAGITGGASLIKSSELRSAIGEARGYAVAVNAFYTQYNSLPGDFNGSVASTDVVGDNDGKIEYTTGATTSIAESSEAWNDLETIGAIDVDLDVVAASGGVIEDQTLGTNYPSSKIKSSGWAFDYNTSTAQNVVVLTQGITDDGTASNSLVNGDVVSNGAIAPADALSMDTKADDGVASTGKIRGVGSSCSSGTAYTVSESTKECAVSYQVDVNS